MTALYRSSNKPGTQPIEGNATPPGALDNLQPPRPTYMDVEMSPDDPLLAHFLSSPGVVEVEKLSFKSPVLEELRSAGVRMTVPLVSQGELIGLINLGPRMSEQDYSSDDRRLLNTLATQAAPALRVAQLARLQQAEARQRERMEQELRVARVIQQTLLPQEVPEPPNWKLAAHWQPARAVSGDFYDFIDLPDGKLGIVIGDVTDKGVPAALVMATTRSVLRLSAERYFSPGLVLEQANDLLCPDIPRNMFVTCLYAILNPEDGQLVFANAGHNLPYKRTKDGVDELRATGMPLGLLPGMLYEENTDTIGIGESLFLYSDGLVEGHNPEGEMFGFPRLRSIMAENPGGSGLINLLLQELVDFTGPDWEQEDDVTFVTLERINIDVAGSPAQSGAHPIPAGSSLLADFTLPSEPGNERQAMAKVAEVVHSLNLPERKLEQLKTAVAEATMNAMEHGNLYNPELNVRVKVLVNDEQLSIFITDQSGGRPIPDHVEPDLEAKLAGLQSPRGWGLFLIQNMVDRLETHTDERHHTVELVIYLKEH